ncbi:MAG: hypothetical protein KBF97_00600 [Bacteroidetes bacterium]|nr:hypothetical protein [Bacteroidota bacterium]
MRFRFCILFLLSVPAAAQAQSDTLWLAEPWYFDAGPAALTDAARFLPPVFREGVLLKRYIRDDRFYQLRKSFDDTLAVDAIYDRALHLTEGDIGMALLVAAIAVMDHRQLGLKIPLLGTVYLPLTMESDSLFKVRRTNLPKRILTDGPKAVDKDKLQHFFGSAFLAYAVNSPIFAEHVGDWVEEWEQRFVLGGKKDRRDQAANALGREFGFGLQKDPEILPSDILWGIQP